MFARLTYTKILPQYIELHRKIYNDEVVPVVCRQKGLIHIMLLEPLQKGDDVISLTEWQSQEDAETYESSGMYAQLLAKIKGLAAREPVLKQYAVETVGAGRPEAHEYY